MQQGWLWSRLEMLHYSLVPTNHQWTLSLHIVTYNTNLSNVVYFFISAVNNQSPVVDVCVYSDISAGITFHWVIPKTSRITGAKISVVTLIFLQWLSMNYFIDTFVTGSGTEDCGGVAENLTSRQLRAHAQATVISAESKKQWLSEWVDATAKWCMLHSA